MSIVDIILALIILSGAYSGYKNGFIVSLFSLVAVILGMLGGFKLMGSIMILLSNKYNIDKDFLPYVAFGVVFLLITIGVNLLGTLIKNSISKSFLGSMDKLVGSLLGLVKVIFMVSILLWISDSLRIRFPEEWTSNSWLHPMTANFAPKITNWIGTFLPIFRNVF